MAAVTVMFDVWLLYKAYTESQNMEDLHRKVQENLLRSPTTVDSYTTGNTIPVNMQQNKD